mmetsp:Transcript_33979/g.74737  ORF Transcript_33979/g.74737 Transcript_33979/m.74737 type:complete len:435 (+) Transcript_33979:63-1367(+)
MAAHHVNRSTKLTALAALVAALSVLSASVIFSPADGFAPPAVVSCPSSIGCGSSGRSSSRRISRRSSRSKCSCLGANTRSCTTTTTTTSSTDTALSDDTRRDFLHRQATTLSTALVSSLLIPTAPSIGISDDKQYPPITQRVALTVRISRQDGTFYVRDDIDDNTATTTTGTTSGVSNSNPLNRVYTGRLLLGLFGTVAPVHVANFLSYCTAGAYDSADIDNDMPRPSYGRSIFTKYDDATGLLEGGYIPGLEVTTIGGGNSLRYGSRILGPARLWIETSGVGDGGTGGNTIQRLDKVSHATGSGLLTHRILDPLPTFGITTRPSPQLDSTFVDFGRLLPDESSQEFIRIVRDEISTYSMDRPSPGGGGGGGSGEVLVPTTEVERASNELANAVFAAQREFFRGAAKSLGDSRVDKVYEGKLLRRVEVTKVELL